MLRRLLACLVALAITLPSVGAVAMVTIAASECTCPPGKADCPDKGLACDCAVICMVRGVVAEPSFTVAPITAGTFAAGWQMSLATAPPDTPSAAPFRPPRLSILG